MIQNIVGVEMCICHLCETFFFHYSLYDTGLTSTGAIAMLWAKRDVSQFVHLEYFNSLVTLTTIQGTTF